MGQICGICIISDLCSLCVVLLTNTPVMSHSLGPDVNTPASTQHHQHEDPANPEPHNELVSRPGIPCPRAWQGKTALDNLQLARCLSQPHPLHPSSCHSAPASLSGDRRWGGLSGDMQVLLSSSHLSKRGHTLKSQILQGAAMSYLGH